MTEIELFIDHLQSEDLAPGTIANYGGNLRLFAGWLDSHKKTITTLTPADLKDYKAQLKERYKPPTINTKLACVSVLLRWCVKNGYINDNPIARIKAVKTETYPRWLTQEQIDLMLGQLQKDIQEAQNKRLDFSLSLAIRLKSVTLFLLNTGLRATELCNLRLPDVKNGVITVKWGKGAKRREIPLNSQARAALDDWLRIRNSDKDYLFATVDKTPMSRYLLLFHLSELGKRLGFRLTPHLLRHTFGKMLADKGIPLDRIAKLMGHSNINTTAIYTMPGLEDLRKAVSVLE